MDLCRSKPAQSLMQASVALYRAFRPGTRDRMCLCRCVSPSFAPSPPSPALFLPCSASPPPSAALTQSSDRPLSCQQKPVPAYADLSARPSPSGLQHFCNSHFPGNAHKTSTEAQDWAINSLLTIVSFDIDCLLRRSRTGERSTSKPSLCG